MGCDIHSFAEMRSGSSWVRMPDLEPLTRRNYNLFAMLAGVRNGRGFAGCDTGDPFTPICLPRGLPADASREVKEEHESWGLDAHSASWLTLADLLAYPVKDLRNNIRGSMTVSTYKAWQEELKTDPQAWPLLWCGSTNAPTILESDYNPDQAYPDHQHIRAQWSKTYYDCVSYFWGEWLEKVKAFSDANNVAYDAIRIVFWFDN